MLNRIDHISSILKNLAIFALVAIMGTYLLLSVIGNIVISINKNPERELPPKRSTPYELTLTTTGQKLFAKKYEVVNSTDPQVYLLSSYYTLQPNGNYALVKTPLELDEAIWGNILIRKR